MKPHSDTVKTSTHATDNTQHNTQHNTTQHNTPQHNTTQHTTQQIKLVLAIGLAKVGFGQSPFWPKSAIPKHYLWPKSVWPNSVAKKAGQSWPWPVVWRGDQSLPTEKQGLTVLGVPVGHPDRAASELAQKADEQSLLFERIPHVEDVQAVWFLLTFCAATRANYWLLDYAEKHDRSVTRCLEQILQMDDIPQHIWELHAFDPWRIGSGWSIKDVRCRTLEQLGRLFGDGAKQAFPHRPRNLGRVGHPHTRVYEGSSRIRTD